MEQVNLNIRLPKYAKIFFSALRWGIVVTLSIDENVMNVLTSKMEEIPVDMFFQGRSKTWKYQKTVVFDYEPKKGICDASEEANKLLRDMQKDICSAKIDILQRRLKCLDFPSWTPDQDIDSYLCDAEDVENPGDNC